MCLGVYLGWIGAIGFKGTVCEGREHWLDKLSVCLRLRPELLHRLVWRPKSRERISQGRE